MDADLIESDVAPSRWGARRWLTALGPFLGLFLVIAAFAVLTGAPEKFLSPFNIRIVLSQTVIVAISAIGMTMIIIGGGIDLSVGSTIALTGVVAALGINAGIDPTVGIALGIAVGAAVGLGERAASTGLKGVALVETRVQPRIARGR